MISPKTYIVGLIVGYIFGLATTLVAHDKYKEYKTTQLGSSKWNPVYVKIVKWGEKMKKNVNVLMDLDLKKALDKDAKKNHRSVGKHINFIIDNYLKGVAKWNL